MAAAAALAAAGAAVAAPAAPAPDPILASYLERALARSRELAARSAEQAARAEGVAEARAGWLPQVTAEVRYTRTWNGLDLGELINPAYATLNELVGAPRFPTDVELSLPLALDAKLRVAQALYVPALRPARHLAELAVSAERVQGRIARREIVAAVSATYYAHARAAQLVELLRTTRALLEENLAVSTALVAAGRATDDVVLRARAELAAHDQRARAAEQGQRAAARALAVLLVEPLDTPMQVPRELPVPPVPAGVAPLQQAARRARGELALAEVAAAASAGQRQLAASAFLPQLVVAVDLGIQRADLGISTDDAYAAATVQASWSLLSGGRDRARVRQRDHEQRAIAARRAHLSDAVAAEVATAWDAAGVARAAVASAEERVAATEAAHAILARRYAANDVPQIEVLTAQSALITARTDRIVAVTELYLRLVELDRVTASQEIAP
jgi:outer membrane protein TolC